MKLIVRRMVTLGSGEWLKVPFSSWISLQRAPYGVDRRTFAIITLNTHLQDTVGKWTASWGSARNA